MKKILCAIFLSFSLLHCGGESNPDGSQSADWVGTLDGATIQILITTQTAEPQSDGGVVITMTGTSDQEDVVMALDVAGGTSIDVPAATDEEPNPSVSVSVGSSTLNILLDIGTSRYRGTSGSVSFTAYEPALGGTVSGDLDLGLTGIGVTVATSATVTGSFTSTVAEPVPDEEE